MSFKLFIVVLSALVLFCRCDDDKVDSEYTITADQFVITPEISGGVDVLVRYLTENGCLGNISVTEGVSRAENDEKALLIYKEKLEVMRKTDLHKVFSLSEEQSVSVTFFCTLKRDGRTLEEEPQQVIIP